MFEQWREGSHQADTDAVAGLLTYGKLDGVVLRLALIFEYVRWASSTEPAASVSKTYLVSFDGNKYSVMAKAVGRPVDIHVYPERLVIRQDGGVVGDRRFGKHQTAFDPWHYVPVLARKPGALRNGAPFKDWTLPASLEEVRRKPAGPRTANGRWCRSSQAFSLTVFQLSKLHAGKHSHPASQAPTSS